VFKKFLFILILTSVLAAFLLFRAYFSGPRDQAQLVDRLPAADVLGRCNVLDLATETSDMLYYNKIPFRDLFSTEFLLSQGKNYGLNLQKSAYFFANENGNWGVLFEVIDSAKVGVGVERLRKLMDLTDTTIYDQKVTILKKEKGYLSYSKNWLFIYKGTEFQKNFKRVYFAKKGVMEPCWEAFLNEEQFKDEKLVLYSNWEKLKEQGIETAIFAHDSDSLSFSLLSCIRTTAPIKAKAKENGLGFEANNSSKKLLNVHLDITELKKDPNDPLYKLLIQLGKKISFPTIDFMNAWEGDLSLLEGGTVTVQENYVESVMDEEFNITEIEKTKEVKVPGYYLMFSVNNKSTILLSKLMSKGILTKEQEKYRLITSPQLTLVKKDGYLYFYSGNYLPSPQKQSSNNGILTHEGTRFAFKIDSIKAKEAFGSIHIPIERLLRRNKFF
jgi:hypothetical protein